MGLFDKLKNILFEPDEDELIEDMHVYTKEEVKEEPSVKKEVKEPVIHEEPPIKTTNTSHFSNVKRDINIDYEDKSILEEVPGAMEAINATKEAQRAKDIPVVPDKPSPFQTFDEKEFERVNSRVTKNETENKIRKEEKKIEEEPVNYRKANNLFSSTNSNINVKIENTNSTTTGKKPFKPSPVISPVYGILDKNYHKDDIVDRQGGMKREHMPKTALKEEKETIIELPEVDIDSVRKKAYGTLEDIDIEVDIPKTNDETFKEEDIILENVSPDVIDIEEEIDNDIDDDVTLDDLIKEQNTIEETKIDNISVEDELEEEFESNPVDNLEVKEQVIEEETEENEHHPRLLDDMEKTSTLQILDDIEKELNSIKPINEEPEKNSEEEMKEKIEKSETLENDLFNLIDSMYEQGEEEDDD